MEVFDGDLVFIAKLYNSGSLTDSLINHFEFKLEHLLKWEDRNSMWFSLKSRVPFLDYRLVERTLSLDPKCLIKNGTTKYILREALKGILPEKIRVRRDKIGFDTPESQWFKQESFKSLINKLINSDSFVKRNIIDKKQVDKMYNLFLSGKINISKEIWKWVNLELWFREFID